MEAQARAMKGMQVYWGDFHKHLENVERADEIIECAKYNLDVYCVLCYPFRWEIIKGARVETVRQRPEFLPIWDRLREAAKAHNDEGSFVTFLGYEWHGNRTKYGDHNVVYFEGDGPLDDAWELEELFENLQDRKAFAIPHHTGYFGGRRGKNWDLHDPGLSPVMEVFSAHGSSEGIDGPLDLLNNRSMGPRTSGGTFVDALDRGIKVGTIASNDGAGLPGSWPLGITGIWSRALTRDAIWEAIANRRTTATTGDRISLWFQLNGHPMGSILGEQDSVDISIEVEGVQPIDKIELVHNGRVCNTYDHPGRWKTGISGEYKTLMEFGWGPSTNYGFKDVDQDWAGTLMVDGGKLLSVQPRFSLLGQTYSQTDDQSCDFNLRTTRDGSHGFRQGLIFNISGSDDTVLKLSVDGRDFELRLEETYSKTHLFPFLGESKKRVESVFGISEGELENPDIYYHNARKVRIHPSYPRESYVVNLKFEGVEQIEEGNNYYYVRVKQVDGQMAWSSPIWVGKTLSPS